MNLLLLRGLIRDQRTWGEFPDRIKAHAPHLNLYFLDLPGVGSENERACPDSIAAIRIDVAQRFHTKVAQGKFPTGPWTLFAMSLGGMVSIDWVNAEPELFQALILLNTSAADVGNVRERFAFRFVPGLLYSLATNRPEDSERLILSAASNRFAGDSAKRDPKLQTVYAEQVRWRRERPVRRQTFIRQFLSGARYRLPNSRPKPPTLVVSSEGDRLVSPRCSARLADRFGASRISHPWAGHDIPMDDPEWLARELTDWIGAPK